MNESLDNCQPEPSGSEVASLLAENRSLWGQEEWRQYVTQLESDRDRLEAEAIRDPQNQDKRDDWMFATGKVHEARTTMLAFTTYPALKNL